MDKKAYVSKVEAKHKNIAHQYFTKSGTIALLPYDEGKEYFSIIFCTNTTLDPTEQFQDYVKELNININLTTLDNFEGGFDLKHQRVSKMNYEKNFALWRCCQYISSNGRTKLKPRYWRYYEHKRKSI